LAPDGRHILHIFTTSSIEDWEGLPPKEYEAKKEDVAARIIQRLEKKLFPGLSSSITFKEVRLVLYSPTILHAHCRNGDSRSA
jgi:prolycopene isomerase